MFSIMPKCEMWFVRTLYILNFGCTRAFYGVRARLQYHGCTARPLADRGERRDRARRRAKKVAQIEKIATLADQHVRSFGYGAAYEAVGLGYSTVGVRPGRRFVVWIARGERGAVQKSEIFKCAKTSSGARR